MNLIFEFYIIRKRWYIRVYSGFLRRQNKKTIKHMKSIAQTVKRVIMNLLKVLHNSQIKKTGIY